ncbi:MAG: GNAT family N-acetyltransferase [Acholeplasmataceae bacterium]|nr:GNAT family N-acetyltransferase [Acholeplasmataceae bacterium]
MITYKRDNDKTYDLEIKYMLRSYNEKFSNIKDSDCVYLYALEDDALIGAMTVNYFWDWASIGEVFYHNKETLKQLVQKAWQYYKNKVVGIKYSSPNQNQLNDFVNAGFRHVNTANYSDEFNFYYADLYALEEEKFDKNLISIHSEPIEIYQKILQKHVELFRETNNIYDMTETFDMVALDLDKCIGGIQCEVYKDSLYISRLAVEQTYRKKGIGTKLMSHTIEFAIKSKLKTIDLGTIEFQARDFYEKFGFKVIHTRQDNPKGYKSYTLIKKLK